MSESITVVGTIGSAPQGHTTQTGRHVTSFRLACTPRVRDRETGEWRDGATNWYSIAVWEQLGRNALGSLHKGERAIVSGRLRLRQWEKDERSGMDAEITATAIGHDLKWGTAQFAGAPRPDRHADAGSPAVGDEQAEVGWDPRPLVPDAATGAGEGPTGSAPAAAPSGFPGAADGAGDADEETPY